MFESLETESVLRRYLWTATVAAIVLAVFWPILSASALCIDDRVYLAENTLVQDPSWASAWRCLTEVATPSSVRGYYHPLAILSLMLDCAFGGQQANLAPFHRTNVLLHLVNVVLVVALLRRLAVPSWAAWLGGLAFGVHPLTVETVAWVGERKALLAGTFGLASLSCYVGYVRSNKPASRSWSYAGALLTTGLALMSRPSSIVLPIMMVVLDWWPLKRTASSRWLDKLPFLAVCGVATAVTLVSHSARVGVEVSTSGTFMEIPLAAAHKLALFARNVVWPVDLTPWRIAPDPLSLSNHAVLVAVVACAAWLVACFALRRRAPALVAGSALFVVGIGPTLGLVKYSIVYAFDNYAYLPLFGSILCLTAGIVELKRRWLPQPWARIVVSIVLAMMILAEVHATRGQIGRWRNTETLYRHMLSLAPDAAILHSDLGLEFERQGRLDDALKEHRRALQIDPLYARAHNNLGLIQARLGHVDEAIASYREAIRLEPDLAEAHNNLGAVLQSAGRLDEAVEEHRQALALRPDWADAHSNLGVAQMGLGRASEALASFRAAVRYKPDCADAYNNLGVCAFELGHMDDAWRDYTRAVDLAPANREFRRNLAELLAQQGRIAESIEQLREVVRLAPEDDEARGRLHELLKPSSSR